MTQLYFNRAATTSAVNSMIDNNTVTAPTFTFTDALDGGVRKVTATWTTSVLVMDGVYYTVAAGSQVLNTADVAVPTTHYLYIDGTSGTPTVTVSTTNPITNPAVTIYAIGAIIRFKSVGGTLTVYWSKQPNQSGVEEVVHNLKEDSVFLEPQWISGISTTLSAGGKVSTDAGIVRFPGNEPRIVAAITEGLLVLEDESATAAGIDSVTTYADGSAITAGKYVKMAVGIMRDKAAYNTTKYMILRQSKPAVEYATAADALTDAENMAPTGFPGSYTAAVTPLFYIVTLKADYTQGGATPAGQIVDIRTTGFTKGAGGAAAASHHALADLTGFDDHSQYIPASGARPLTGNWDAGAFEIRAETFESDVATGTAPFTVASTTVVANLNASTLEGNAAAAFAVAAKGVTNGDTHDHAGGDGAQIDHGGLGGLADDDHTQYLLANGTRNLSGNMTATAGVTIDGVDISAHAADTEAHHATVTLSVAADNVLSLTTQLIGLDTQTATYALMGPTSGGAAAPTFRKILDADIVPATATMTLVNADNDNVLGTDAARVYLIDGPTKAFTISGISGGTDGRVIHVINRTGQNLTFENEEATSDAANRIVTSTGADIATTGNGSGILVYITGTLNRWVLTATSL